MMPIDPQIIQISAVIPTCNRVASLRTLLESLDRSTLIPMEVLLVDAGDHRIAESDLRKFHRLSIRHIHSERSVCIQRNAGIQEAKGTHIFLCDDDMELTPTYLQDLRDHLLAHPQTGAVSGLVLQNENGTWQGSYPVTSASELLRKFIFQLGIWGEIDCPDTYLSKKIKRFYQRKGNHISKAGWPVITAFSGNYFDTPIYGLGASLVRKQWLQDSPYEEALDRNGIGDNYGVAMGFPVQNIQILPATVIYHHQETANRPDQPLLYLRRVLALDYFIRSKEKLRHIRKRWLLWSLTGNLLMALAACDRKMIRSTFRSLRTVAFGPNPYLIAARQHRRITEPVL